MRKHLKVPNNSDDYQKLKKVWYKKLKKDGFVDIERDENTIEKYSSVFNRELSYVEASGRLTYYTMATSFLHDYDFPSELDRIIWEYHSNGISYRNIARLLKKARVSKLGYNGIHLRIKKMCEIMFESYLKSDTE